MQIEQRTIYIVDDGTEYDEEEDCRHHETVNKIMALLSPKFSEYVLSYSEFIVNNFAEIKKIVEG